MTKDRMTAESGAARWEPQAARMARTFGSQRAGQEMKAASAFPQAIAADQVPSSVAAERLMRFRGGSSMLAINSVGKWNAARRRRERWRRPQSKIADI